MKTKIYLLAMLGTFSVCSTQSQTSTASITSYEFLYEQMQQLPETLQDVADKNRYAYIFSKAALFIHKGAEQYRENDDFHYPLKEWNVEKLIAGCNQIIYHCKGLSAEHCFEDMSENDFKNLLELFHFQSVKIEKTSSEGVVKGIFTHKMDGGDYFFYCRVAE